MFNEEVKPRAKEAWRNAQPGIEHAKVRLKRFAEKLRDEYRKGRDREIGRYSPWRRQYRQTDNESGTHSRKRSRHGLRDSI